MAPRPQEVLQRRVGWERQAVSLRREYPVLQAASQPERQARPEEQAAWVRIRPRQPAVSAQTAPSVNLQTAAFLPDRWP